MDRIGRNSVVVCLALAWCSTLVGATTGSSVVNSGQLRNFRTKQNAGLVTTESRTYKTVPQMSTNISTSEETAMLVTYCAESAVDAPGGQVLVRFEVDGVFSPSFQLTGQGLPDGEYDSHCVSWAFSEVEAGEHKVSVAYRATTGKIYQYARTLTILYDR